MDADPASGHRRGKAGSAGAVSLQLGNGDFTDDAENGRILPNDRLNSRRRALQGGSLLGAGEQRKRNEKGPTCATS
jgi:hypothetical protein